MLTTKQLRGAWAPACDVSQLRVVELVQGVRVQCRDSVGSAVQALGRVLEAHNYQVRAGDTGAFVCRKITNGTGHSLHAFGIALDINWNTNPYRDDNVLVTDMPRFMINDILSVRTNSGEQVWGWGGNYRNVKDAMHYEIVCAPEDLATGIDWSTVQQVELRPETPHRWPLIQRGDRGPAVEKLQELLGVALPGEPGYGTFGPRTEVAVLEYQATHGLEVDGRVGRQTWTSLLSGQPEVAPDEPGPVKRLRTTPAAAPILEPTPMDAAADERILAEVHAVG